MNNYKKITFLSLVLAVNTLNSMSEVRPAILNVPSDILEVILLYCSPDEQKFEDLQELLKCMRINKKFKSIADKIYNKRLMKQKGKIEEFMKCNNPPTPYIQAIYDNYIYWIHDHLKINPHEKANHNFSNHCWPLHYVAWFNRSDMAKLLVAAGAKIDQHDTDCDTPLIDAIRNSSWDVIKILLESNADVRIKIRNYSTLQYAENSRNDEIVRLIKQKLEEQNKLNNP